jgi:arylsulfatase A-like enzyme
MPKPWNARFRPAGLTGIGMLCALASLSCRQEPAEGDPASPPAHRPNILLITLDTTRADRLGCYGSFAGLTPNLDALASKGTVFERAIAQASVTPVSHASILTGLNPYSHGLRVMHGTSSNRLADAKVTLAEVLEQAGYQTAAFVSAFPVTERFGLHQGFDTFDGDFGEANRDQAVGPTGIVNTGRAQRRADHTTDRALAWLRDCGEPFFLWVHYFDPHDPFVLPPKDFQQSIHMPPEAKSDLQVRLRAIHEGEVRYMDLHLGRLLDELERTGLADEMVIVVVADHGEGLGDHDWWTHGILYQEQVRVPLIIRAPGKAEGRRVRRLARTIDIMPTVLDLAGVGPEARPPMDGVSLIPQLEGRAVDRRLVAYSDSVNTLTYRFAEGVTDHKGEVLFAVLDWPWKLIYHQKEPSNSELYNLADDPGELHNLLPARQDQARRLFAELRSRDFLPGDELETEEMSPEDIERLKSLGYIE